MRRTWSAVAAFALGVAVLGGGALSAGAHGEQATPDSSVSSLLSSARGGVTSVARFIGFEDDEVSVAPGALDDGKDLLPQATISLEQAIETAQGAASGPLGEVDLEHFKGRLVFNVDVGDKDVKVDAATGDVLGAVSDD